MTKNHKISAVIVAHNEEKKIEDCLKSLNFADEIVVVLDKCSDKTKEIVLKYTNKIIEGSWNIEGARRNVAVSSASYDWILEIDADERISDKLAKEIKENITKHGNQNVAFSFKIDNYIGKRLVRNGWLRTICVLQRQSIARNGHKIYDEDKEVHPTANLKAEKIISLSNPLIHLVDENISDLLLRFNRYTSWKANDMIFRSKIKGGFLNLIISFKLRFFKSYILKAGIKEGLLGLVIATLSGLYPIISYLKAKEKILNEKPNNNHSNL